MQFIPIPNPIYVGIGSVGIGTVGIVLVGIETAPTSLGRFKEKITFS